MISRNKKNQMMDPFGGDDFFSSNVNSMMQNFDTFGIQSQFQQMDKQMNRMNQMMNMDFDTQNHEGGYTVSKTYVSNTQIGKDGKPITEKYFDNNLVQKGKNGQTISERQQGYKNSLNNYKQVAQERMLNDQGRKFVQEKHGNGPINTTNYYHNIDEGQKDHFDQKWNNHCEDVNFHQGIQKYLGGNSRHMQIQNDPYQQPVNYAQNYGQNQRQQQNLNQPTLNDARRGDYIPNQRKMENQPVRLNQSKKNDYMPKNGLPMPEYSNDYIPKNGLPMPEYSNMKNKSKKR